jgi:hypothetical protein
MQGAAVVENPDISHHLSRITDCRSMCPILNNYNKIRYQKYQARNSRSSLEWGIFTDAMGNLWVSDHSLVASALSDFRRLAIHAL